MQLEHMEPYYSHSLDSNHGHGIGYLATPLEITVEQDENGLTVIAKGSNGTEVIDAVISAIRNLPRSHSYVWQHVAIALCSATLFGCLVGTLIPQLFPPTNQTVNTAK